MLTKQKGWKHMDIFNNDIDNVNKVIVSMSHRMNKRW